MVIVASWGCVPFDLKRRVTFPWFVLCTRCYFFLLWFVPYVKMIIGLPLFYGSKLLLVYTLVVIKYNILEKFPDKLTLHHTVYITLLAKVILDTWNQGHYLFDIFFWRKLVKISFLAKLIDIERGAFWKKFQKRQVCFVNLHVFWGFQISI